MGLHRRDPQPDARLDLDVMPKPTELSVVRRALAQLSLPGPMLADARLLVSELLTNSIRHAGLGSNDRIRVIAQVSGERLRVDVIDGGRTDMHGVGGMRPTPGSESGWGLFLVEALASQWGIGRDRHWFELELELERQPEPAR